MRLTLIFCFIVPEDTERTPKGYFISRVNHAMTGSPSLPLFPSNNGRTISLKAHAYHDFSSAMLLVSSQAQQLSKIAPRKWGCEIHFVLSLFEVNTLDSIYDPVLC